MSTLQRIAHEQKGKLAHAHNIALQRQKEKETSGGGSSADKNSNKGKDDDGAHLEADIFLVSCFELIKFNQRKLLGRMKDTGLKNGACAWGGAGWRICTRVVSFLLVCACPNLPAVVS